MTRRNLYLVLALAGLILPYRHFVPWVIEHGLDVPLFFAQLFANPIAAFFASDVIVSSVVVFVFVRFERKHLGSRWWIPLAAVLTVGVSLALPLALYLRETYRQASGE